MGKSNSTVNYWITNLIMNLKTEYCNCHRHQKSVMCTRDITVIQIMYCFKKKICLTKVIEFRIRNNNVTCSLCGNIPVHTKIRKMKMTTY